MNLTEIGKIRTNNGRFLIELNEAYKEGLLELEHFNYIHVLWWANGCEDQKSRSTLVTPLPYADKTTAGVFACRSPYRPNPVSLSVCPVLHVDKDNGVIELAYIDALDNTPLIDIKPYIAVSDRVRSISTAPWFKTWPGYFEDAAEFFSKPENQFFD